MYTNVSLAEFEMARVSTIIEASWHATIKYTQNKTNNDVDT